ncbi:MAG: hypothetical protein AAF740_01525 [Bacteroidota bacterium]
MKTHFFTILMFLLMQNLYAQDQGMTSETHKKYVGKIVFSSNPDALTFAKEIPSDFKTSFSADEPIYTKIYLAKSLANETYEGQQEYATATLFYRLFIDGKQVGFKRKFGNFPIKYNKENEPYYSEELNGGDQFRIWTTWRHFLLPKDNDPELKYGNRNIAARAFILALLDVEPGTHEIKLELLSQSRSYETMSDVVASGEFTLKLTAADQKNLAFKHTPPLPQEKWQGGSKSEILAELKTAFVQEFKDEPLKIGILSPNWSENTYRLTGQRYRKLAAYAIWPDKDGDGLGKITGYNWISDYNNGSWTTLRFDSHCNDCPRYDVEVAAVKALGDG